MAFATIDKPSKYFSTTLWVADDTSPRTLTGFGHKPDMVWVKHRGSASINPTIIDRVRGGDKMLATPIPDAEDTKSHGEITAWNADGITVADGTSGTYPRLYFNDFDPFGSGGGNYVAWSWSASGTTPVSNTQGSITSTVSVNTTAGFSIVSFTGNGSNSATVGHGLGVVPKMIIEKSRTASFDGSWWVNHNKITSGTLRLNSTDATRTDFPSGWINESPTSSTFSFTAGSGGTVNNVNYSGDAYIAYCFAEVKGFSKFGSYTGNGSADGVFVYTGFKPAMVIFKETSGISSWYMFDNKLNTYNVCSQYLRANISAGESTFTTFDMLSNGFKIRNTDGDFNGSGSSYIYMAFAENPFTSSKGIPCTAR